MQISAIVVSLLVASAQALGEKDTVESQCKRMTKLNRYIEIAANDTQLAQRFGTDQARIDDFKAQAPEAMSMLQELQANATLAAACPAINAALADGEMCKAMHRFEDMVALATNETNVVARFEGNATQIAEFKEKLPSRAARLTTMQANTTLTAFCAVRDDQISCRHITKLEGMIEMSHNTTALMAKFEGNSTKIQEFQEKTARMQAKLDSMTANTTLTATCASLARAGTDNQDPSSGDVVNGNVGGGDAGNGAVSGGVGVGSGISTGGTTRGGGTAEEARSLGTRIGQNMSPAGNLAVLALAVFVAL